MTRIVRAVVLALACGSGFLGHGVAQAQTTERAQNPALADAYAEVGAARDLVLQGEYDAARPIVEPLADAGNAVAQNLMGIILQETAAQGTSLIPALDMYQRAGAQGYGKAYFNAGVLYLNGGEGVPADASSAVDAFARGAAAGYQPAHEDWVWYLQRGGDTVEDHDLAFEQAVIGVDEFADSILLRRLLADAYFYGIGTSVDASAALIYYDQAADLGDPSSQLFAGYQYFAAVGTAQDYGRARARFEQAAEQDDQDAFGYLARMYYFGLGVPLDYGQAWDYARQGYGRDGGQAAYIAGLAYLNGHGIPQDFQAANAAFTTAYEAGDIAALQLLGDMAYFGQGEPVDFAKAMRIYEQVFAENPDNPDAVYSIGYMLMRGEGAAVNIPLALDFIERALILEQPDAILEAILLYGSDEFSGVHSNPVPTAAYCMYAATNGTLSALGQTNAIQAICDATMGDLTAEDRAAAEAFAGTL